MSIALQSQVWSLELPLSDKMVLMALADSANDDGIAWIAIRTLKVGKMDLMKKCSLKERALQGAIKRLCEGRYLTRKEVSGQGVWYGVYPAANAPLDADAPPHFMRACPPKCPDSGPPHIMRPAANAGKPSPSEDKSSSGRARVHVRGARGR